MTTFYDIGKQTIQKLRLEPIRAMQIMGMRRPPEMPVELWEYTRKIYGDREPARTAAFEKQKGRG